ncbi:conserved Plasmodium protein, unknown function [Plasmodium berghei]|uniref:Surface-related antigen SRA, putative n=2 Tax=Plasmodium berghei TaxID=5821 RepID=A0A509AJB9_PLABA|nr:surface-related antigen SRA, putative [Plasmodium berghei ANKA]CXI51131.1 conserved Plasmodium protein, unknown function [Plasmodium berghei]SCL94398.1 conserved Plasmodium protein, unknown function [Plasmodium berghei]SCM16008.1 conserved Plasmodium protein, unknown function [Plasmodium berghei]SCM17804.1 conserved Plasmodium protein, unknown function [Plasmodium berghei]SCN26052.1 conserved Plasmodium protein, unknown function [Plasmodium berghei]|eukprot:XP_034421933.1 surface-related antigen SRA, putative [Plasmodium berghei ANKA]
MILSFKIKLLILFIYLYMRFVNSNKQIQNTLSQNISNQLYRNIVPPLNNVNNISNPFLNGNDKKKDNKHTCEAAGCSSYKNIIKNNDNQNSNFDDCLNGFICKKCKKTHAKNSNICFYSNIEGYQNLYEALLEEYTLTPYDDFKILLNKYNNKKGDENKNDVKKNSDNENDQNDNENDQNDNENEIKKNSDNKNEDEDDDDEDDEDEKKKKKSNENKDDDIVFFEKKANTNSYQGLNKTNESTKNDENANIVKFIEKTKYKQSKNKHYNFNILEPFEKKKQITQFSTNNYSFLFEKNKKSEKIVYKRLKININKYEEYLKNKLNKCDISNDGMITVYIKLLLQIVKDKNDIYVDISKKSIVNSKEVNKYNNTKTQKQTNNQNDYYATDDNDNDSDSDSDSESDSDNDEFYGYNKKKSNNYSYLEMLNLMENKNNMNNNPNITQFSKSDKKKLSTNSESKQDKNKTSNLMPNYKIIKNITKYNFYQERLTDDLDGDSMGNYYKSKNGFFKSLFSKIYRKKKSEEYDDYDSDSSTDDDNEYDSKQKKKKRYRLFSWKKNKNKNKQTNRANKNYDNDNEYEKDDKYSSRRNYREEDDDDDNNNDDDESKKNQNNNKIDDKQKNQKKSKIKAFFNQIKKKIIPEKQKLHIESFFNSIIVKSCKNSIKWEGKMFKKKSLIEVTLKVPVKIKYIENQPLNFFRSGFETILTCHNCDDIIFNSCVQVYCTKKNEHEQGKDTEINQTQNTPNESVSTVDKLADVSQIPYMAGASVFSHLPVYNHNNYYPGNTSMLYYDSYSEGKNNYFNYFVFFFIFMLNCFTIW